MTNQSTTRCCRKCLHNSGSGDYCYSDYTCPCHQAPKEECTCLERYGHLNCPVHNDHPKPEEVKSSLVIPFMLPTTPIPMTKSQTPIQAQEDWVDEFDKRYDFSENETLKYDNLLTIKSFISKTRQQAIETERRRMIEGVKGMKKDESWGWDQHFKGDQCCPGDDLAEMVNKVLEDIKSLINKQD